MYFTQVQVRNNKPAIISQYISTRLIRKGETASYYVAKCLTNRVDPTIKNNICFIKQTKVKQDTDQFASGVANSQVSKVEKVRRLYNNEIRIHKYVEENVNYSSKLYSKMLDYWHDTEGLYHRFTIVTKYQQYGDLNHFLWYVKENKIQLSDVEVIYVLNNLLKSSLELYKIGVIHRDIKPQNVFIDEFFQFKIGDFGVSYLDESNIDNPACKQIVGTYGFMAPDYWMPEPYSFPVDVWAIGVIIYWMIYLNYPFGTEKKGYPQRVSTFVKQIVHVSTYSDRFSKRLKDFMKRFFTKIPSKRQKSIVLYEYEYMHEFRLIDVVGMYRKKYQEYIKNFNKGHLAQIQRYPLQQHCLYHERILDVVRYQQWGYFFFLSSLKVVGLFNSDANKKVVRIFPDCLDDVNNPKQDLHCNIISHVYKVHFHKFKQYLENRGKVYTKNLNCTISNIVQSKDTLVVRLKTDVQLSKRQLQSKKGDVQKKVTATYQKIQPSSINQDPIDYANNTIQIFFLPFTTTKYKQMQYTTYESSIIFHNNMIRRDEVLCSKILNNQSDTYEITKYPSPQHIYFSDNANHKNMLRHAQKLFSFVIIRRREIAPETVAFLGNRQVNQI